MTKEEIIKQYEMAVEGGELIAPFMGEDEKELYEMLKAGLSALRPITREQVEKMRGEWIDDGEKVPVDENGCPKDWAKCSVCGEYLTASEEYDCTGHFCPTCGSPMTDKAVDMVMERLEALYGQENT